MKKKRKTALWVLLIIAGIAAAAGVYARTTDSIAVKNHIFMGDVNISLKEYTRRNQKEYRYQNPQTLLPGDRVSKIPRITNEGEPCWIRARMEFGTAGGKRQLSEKHVRGITDDWIKRGEYYYYSRILKKGEAVDFFTGLHIPENWDSAYEEQKLDLQIRVEAIQAAHFQPDFAAMSPWGNEEIQLCVHEKNGVQLCRTQRLKLTVEFHKDAQKLLAAPGDFFHNFKALMPGDTCKDSIYLSNTSAQSVSLWFQTRTTKRSEQEKALLKNLSLEISMDGRLLYEGDLISEALSQPVLLGTFLPEQEGTLDFTVRVPSSLNNAFALEEGEVIWAFLAELTEEPSETRKEVSPPDSPVRSEKETNEKTGDESPFLPYFLLALASLTAVVGVLYWKGGNTHEK